MGRPNATTYVPAGDRTRKASSPLESRLRDLIAHHELTAALWRRSAELVDLAVIQECRASSLWKVGDRWAVAVTDVGVPQVHLFAEEGPARDKHTRITERLQAKPPHEITSTRKRGTPRSAPSAR